MKKSVCVLLKALFLCALFVLVLGGTAALADSPVGRWSGSFSGAGKGGGASATFTSGGGVTLSALGISASGSYGGGSIRVSSHGYSLTLHYSVSGDRMTISGGAGGYHGSMSLRRVGGGGGDSAIVAERKRSLSGQWAAEADGVRYEASFYADGFLYWAETPAADEGAAPSAYGARLTVSKDKLTLKPLDEAVPQEMPALWPEVEQKGGVAWELAYAVDKESLKLSKGDEALLTLSRVKDTDATPAEALFRPYIALKQGKRGEAVKQLQQALIAAGCLDGEADGVFGAATRKAVKAFQKSSGLKEDGVAGKEVFSALYG